MGRTTSETSCKTDEFLRQLSSTAVITREQRARLEQKLSKYLQNSSVMAEILSSAGKAESLEELEFCLDVMADDHLLTARELGSLLGWHPDTVYRVAREGKIPSVVVGTRSRRFRVPEIRRWVKTRH